MSSPYDHLAAAAAAGTLEVIEGSIVRGQAALDASRQLLLEATGGQTIAEATQIALGRPPLTATRQGPSPVWKVRVPDQLDQAVRELANQQGVTISQLVREATARYVRAVA